MGVVKGHLGVALLVSGREDAAEDGGNELHAVARRDDGDVEQPVVGGGARDEGQVLVYGGPVGHQHTDAFCLVLLAVDRHGHPGGSRIEVAKGRQVVAELSE